LVAGTTLGNGQLARVGDLLSQEGLVEKAVPGEDVPVADLTREP
jgi:alpha-D-ribose 1-methylphosphonate 5-triphosphate synthase subunit PhnI